MKFTEYCAANNIELLREDMRFIRSKLHGLTHNQIKRVLKRYTEEWLLGYSEEENEPMKQNSGRYRANFWLLTEMED